MMKTTQDMEIEVESLKKAQTKIKLEKKTLRNQIKTSAASLTKRAQDNERESWALKTR